jgi:D-glycero-beta-D-manno-heptose 1-phosphate adenylyltransferase
VATQKQKTQTQEQRHKKIVPFRGLRQLSTRLKHKGKKIVFTTGSFDLLSPGHCRYLAEAKSKGDILVVGVSPDDVDSRINGSSAHPMIHKEIRMELVCHLRTVDYVTEAPEDSPHGVLALLEPDIFFTSEGAWEKGHRDEEEIVIVKTYGGEIVKRERHYPYFGTSALVEHIADIRILQTLQKYIRKKLPDFYLDPTVHMKPVDFGDQTPKYKRAFDATKRLVAAADLEELGKQYRKKNKSIVFVSGSYDLLHVGHARFIEQAGSQGDILVVGIPSDDALRMLKGDGRPVITARDRAYVLGHLDYVDHVVIFENVSVMNSLEKLKPNVFFTVKEEWNSGLKKSPEYKCVKKYGGDIATAKRQAPFMSASTIIDKMALKRIKEIFSELVSEKKIELLGSENSFPDNGNK